MRWVMNQYMRWAMNQFMPEPNIIFHSFESGWKPDIFTCSLYYYMHLSIVKCSAMQRAMVFTRGGNIPSKSEQHACYIADHLTIDLSNYYHVNNMYVHVVKPGPFIMEIIGLCHKTVIRAAVCHAKLLHGNVMHITFCLSENVCGCVTTQVISYLLAIIKSYIYINIHYI